MPATDEREFRYRRRVQFAETDMAGIVHFSWYFRYMEEAEHALWRAAGLSIAPAEPTSAGPAWRRRSTTRARCASRTSSTWACGSPRCRAERSSTGFTLRRETTVLGHGLLTAACVTRAPDGALTAIEVPAGILDRLRGAMSGG